MLEESDGCRHFKIIKVFAAVHLRVFEDLAEKCSGALVNQVCKKKFQRQWKNPDNIEEIKWETLWVPRSFNLILVLGMCKGRCWT